MSEIKIHELEALEMPSNPSFEKFLMRKRKEKIPVVAWVAFILGGAVLVFHFIINPIFNLI